MYCEPIEGSKTVMNLHDILVMMLLLSCAMAYANCAVLFPNYDDVSYAFGKYSTAKNREFDEFLNKGHTSTQSEFPTIDINKIEEVVKPFLNDYINSRTKGKWLDLTNRLMSESSKEPVQNAVSITAQKIPTVMEVEPAPSGNAIVKLFTKGCVSLMNIVKRVISTVNLRKATIMKATGLLVTMFVTSIFVNTDGVPGSKTMEGHLTLKSKCTNSSDAVNISNAAAEKAVADEAAAPTKKAVADEAAYRSGRAWKKYEEFVMDLIKSPAGLITAAFKAIEFCVHSTFADWKLILFVVFSLLCLYVYYMKDTKPAHKAAVPKDEAAVPEAAAPEGAAPEEAAYNAAATTKCSDHSRNRPIIEETSKLRSRLNLSNAAPDTNH